MDRTSDYFKDLTKDCEGEIVPDFKWNPADPDPCSWSGPWFTDDGRSGFLCLLSEVRMGKPIGWSVHCLGTDDDDMARFYDARVMGADNARREARSLWAFLTSQQSDGVSRGTLQRFGLESF